MRSSRSWRCGFLGLSGFSATATTTFTGLAVGLTATTSCNIGPTPEFVEIFDFTTGALVQVCATGTSCSVTVAQSAASTHGYIAYLDLYSSTNPPATIFGKSATIYVTWEVPQNDFSVSLTGPSLVGAFSGPGTYIATVNQDVGPTPYWIEIFDETSCAQSSSRTSSNRKI